MLKPRCKVTVAGAVGVLPVGSSPSFCAVLLRFYTHSSLDFSCLLGQLYLLIHANNYKYLEVLPSVPCHHL